MIDAAPRYKFAPDKIKMTLLAKLLSDGQPTVAALECAQDCVNAGRVTPFWRSQMATPDADALDKDLRSMQHD